MKLEVRRSNDESTEISVKEAKNLMARLGIQAQHVIKDAYVDLLARQIAP